MFEPSLVHGSVTTLSPFRYWCQKVLPLVYDNSLSYYELLCKVVEYLNETMENVNTIGENTNALYNSYLELVEYVNNYFTNLDVQNEINNKLDEMAESGELGQLLNSKLEKFLFIGDSYLALNDIISQTVSDLLHASYVNYGNVSSGFIRKGQNDKNYMDLLIDAVNDNTFDNSLITRVIITGGYNDMGLLNTENWNNEAFVNSVTNICNYIKQNFANAKITIIPFTWIDVDVSTDFKKLHSWLVNACVLNGVNYAKYAIYWLYGKGVDNNNVDNIHPSDIGCKNIAMNIASTIQGSDNELVDYDFIDIAGGTLDIYQHGIEVILKGNFTYNGDDKTPLFILPSKYKVHGGVFNVYKYGLYNNAIFGYIFGSSANIQYDMLELNQEYWIRATLNIT